MLFIIILLCVVVFAYMRYTPDVAQRRKLALGGWRRSLRSFVHYCTTPWIVRFRDKVSTKRRDKNHGLQILWIHTRLSYNSANAEPWIGKCT